MDVKQVINNAKLLSSKERAFLAHCLISSLETKQEPNSDQAWADLSLKRFDQLLTGEVSPVSWDDIKKVVQS